MAKIKFYFISLLILSVVVMSGYTIWQAFRGNVNALAFLMFVTHTTAFALGHMLNQRSVERTIAVNGHQDSQMFKAVTEMMRSVSVGVQALAGVNKSLTHTANQRFEPQSADDYIIDVSPDVARLLDETI